MRHWARFWDLRQGFTPAPLSPAVGQTLTRNQFLCPFNSGKGTEAFSNSYCRKGRWVATV
jgi:hypothetical protein